jgi:methylmalonyl-CoA mutase C-terminal domain/subunit
MSQGKIRVLIAKPGLDGHDRGAKVVARALRDAGMEVIYTGIRQTPEMIVEAALQEDSDVVVLTGGIIPDDDAPVLQAAGVRGIFGPGTNTQDIVRFIEEQVEATASLDEASAA